MFIEPTVLMKKMSWVTTIVEHNLGTAPWMSKQAMTKCAQHHSPQAHRCLTITQPEQKSMHEQCAHLRLRVGRQWGVAFGRSILDRHRRHSILARLNRSANTSAGQSLAAQMCRESMEGASISAQLQTSAEHPM